MREEERVEAEVELTLNINGEFHIHHHHHHGHNPSQPGAADIINSIQEMRTAIMTQLDTSTAKETGDFQTLLTAVEALEAAFTALEGQNNTALQAALDAANLDSATQAAILDANDAAIQSAKDKINALLNPPTGGTDTTGGTGGGTDTTGGTGGNDTVPAGGGTDTTGGGTGSDTITASDLSVTSSSSTFPDGQVGQSYTGALNISGGTGPYSVVADTASVNGLTMDDTGAVAGTPTVAGGVSFSGTVADSASPTNAHVPFSVSFNIAEAVATA